MAAIFAPFIAPVFNVIGEVLKRVLPPEKMTEAERAAIEAKLQVELMKADWSAIEAEFRDRADARALAKADVERGNAFSNLLAASVRPVWGLSSLIVVAYPYLAGAMDWPAVNIDDATKDIIQLVIIFYFGGRSLERILPQVINKK